MTKRVYMLSLGCDKNTVDAEYILGDLVANGYSVTKNIKEADLVIVNTCCFIEEAKVESVEAIFDCLENKNSSAEIIVTGCLSQRYKDELEEEIPEIDGFFKLNEQNKILDFLKLKENEKGRRYLKSLPYAYLKISEGCNRNCSYCAIPSIRGKHVSLQPEKILEEAKLLEEQGIQELILVAQDLTQYGSDLNEEINLNGILTHLAQDFNFKWIRLLYLYPEGLTDEILKTIKNHSNILPYFDMPIQHTSNRILKKMNRHISKDQIKELVEKIRKELPEAVLRSTVIVGFPSETEDDFNELINDLKELKFDRLGAFSYSREEGTPAFNFDKQIDESVKKERINRLNDIQSQIMKNNNNRFINHKFDCLVEDQLDKYTYSGRIYADAPEIDCITYINSSRELKVGEIVPVYIREILDYDLIGDFYESTE